MRVVISGYGTAAPTGLDPASLWSAVCEGRSSLQRLEGTLEMIGPGAGAQVPFQMREARHHWDTRRLRTSTMSRPTSLGCLAELGAMDAACLPREGEGDPDTGTYIGAFVFLPTYLHTAAKDVSWLRRTEGGEASIDDTFLKRATQRSSAFEFLKALPNMAGAQLGILGNFQGPNNTYLASSASGLQAMLGAVRVLRDGRADRMATGGIGAPFEEILMTWLDQRGLYQTADCETGVQPFGLGRSGTLPGEGAAIFVLEREDSARRRDVSGLGEVVDVVTRFAPEDDEAAALEARTQVVRGVVNALGGPPDMVVVSGLGHARLDNLEARAIAAGLGAETAAATPTTCITPTTGYLSSAHAPMGMVVALQSMQHGVIPGVPGSGRWDPEVPRLGMTETNREANVKSAAVFSFSEDGVHAGAALRCL